MPLDNSRNYDWERAGAEPPRRSPAEQPTPGKSFKGWVAAMTLVVLVLAVALFYEDEFLSRIE